MASELVLAESGGLLESQRMSLSETGAAAVELRRQLLYMQQSSNVTINTSICHIPEVAAMALNHTELAEMCGHLLAAPIIPDYVMTIIQVFYALVCMLGLLGNSLVIYVVLRFSKMHTVTNTYILHLAMADECFLVGIPFLIVTMFMREWPFGTTMCKIYFTTTSINQITSSLFLMVLSADRYIAVCHPINSPKFRTGTISKIVSCSVWLLSAVLMLPVLLYATTISRPDGRESCSIEWKSANIFTDGDVLTEQTAFTFYSLVFGFLGPLVFIFIFYLLVLIRLRSVGPQGKGRSENTRRANSKVTKLVLTVVTVFIFCWLPHWVTQVLVILQPPSSPQSSSLVTSILFANCLQYSNSAMNPLLYAGLSDNFRKSFRKACHCGLFWQDPNPQPRNYSFTTRRTVRGPRFTAVLQEDSSSRMGGRPDPSTHVTSTSSRSQNSTASSGEIGQNQITTAVVNGLLAPPPVHL